MSQNVESWSSVSWLEVAVSWLDEQLSVIGNERTGDVEQPHLEPWATVLKAPTTGGTVWLKAVAGSTAIEVRLYVRISVKITTGSGLKLPRIRSAATLVV